MNNDLQSQRLIPSLDETKKPRLFYYEDAEGAWCPAEGLSIGDIIGADVLSEGGTFKIVFKRIDMTDAEFNAIPEG